MLVFVAGAACCCRWWCRLVVCGVLLFHSFFFIGVAFVGCQLLLSLRLSLSCLFLVVVCFGVVLFGVYFRCRWVGDIAEYWLVLLMLLLLFGACGWWTKEQAGRKKELLIKTF